MSSIPSDSVQPIIASAQNASVALVRAQAMIHQVSMTTFTDFIDQLPSSFCDFEAYLLTLQPDVKGWNEDITSLNRVNIKNIMAAAARAFASYTLGLYLCFLGGCYHLGAGVSLAALALYEAYDQDDNIRNKTAHTVKRAFEHIMLAAYNYIASVPTVNMVFCACYAVIPQMIEERHRAFAGTEIVLPTEARKQLLELAQQIEHQDLTQSASVNFLYQKAEPLSQEGVPVDAPRRESWISTKAAQLTQHFHPTYRVKYQKVE